MISFEEALAINKELVTEFERIVEIKTIPYEVSKTMSGGKKNDGDKPQLDLIPYPALEETAKAFMYGAGKYGRWNYKKGLAHSRLINAALRHINQYKEGEDLDSESGYSHLGHAMASLAMLLDGVKNHPELDDRFKKETT